MNLISEIAKEIMLKGYKRNADLNIPSYGWYCQIAHCVYDTPECPKDFRFLRLEPEKEIAIAVTGGLDSNVLYFRAKKKYKNIRAFYIDIGQEYAQKEMNALKKLGIKYEYIKGVDLTKKLKGCRWKHIIPGRNFYFLSLIAEQIKGGTILFGCLEGEMPEQGGDKSKEFLELVNKTFHYFPYEVEVLTPLEKETKTDLVRWWLKNLPRRKLSYTTTCFSSEKGNCGRCQSCLRKAIAYVNNGLRLKTNTKIVEGCQEYINKYIVKMNQALKEKDFTHYSKKRCLQDLAGIKKLWKK